MRQRQIGAGGPLVSEIGLGCMGMSFAYGPRDDIASAQTLNRALDLGVTHLDTADMYGYGHNEELIGRTLGGRRDEFVLATKFANRIENPDDPTSRRFVDSSAAWAKQACDASLRRLGFDTIDLYYMHRRNPQTPIEETVSGDGRPRARRARCAGSGCPRCRRRPYAPRTRCTRSRRYRWSTRCSPVSSRARCSTPAANSVWRWWPIHPSGAACSPARSLPIRRGRADDFRPTQPRFSEANLAANVALADAVREIAAESGATPAQAALAWLLAQGDDVLPIPGTKRIPYLEENVAAADMILSADQLERLAAAVPPDQVAGERYAPSGMRTVGQ